VTYFALRCFAPLRLGDKQSSISHLRYWYHTTAITAAVLSGYQITCLIARADAAIASLLLLPSALAELYADFSKTASFRSAPMTLLRRDA